MTHCRLASVIPRSRCACGRAVLTMVASSTTINCATAMTLSAIQRRGSGAGDVPGAEVGEVVVSETVPGTCFLTLAARERELRGPVRPAPIGPYRRSADGPR